MKSIEINRNQPKSIEINRDFPKPEVIIEAFGESIEEIHFVEDNF